MDISLFDSERGNFLLMDVYSRHATTISLRVTSARFVSPVSQELEEDIRSRVARDVMEIALRFT